MAEVEVVEEDENPGERKNACVYAPDSWKYDEDIITVQLPGSELVEWPV